LPIQLGTPTWRACRKWTKDVESVNAAAVGLLRSIMQQFTSARMILAGVIGPASDGYEAREALSANVQIWALDKLACAGEFELVLLGGCCGTDERYTDALAWVSVAD
jgi:methionine synthase I (cobalamin-dependent)